MAGCAAAGAAETILRPGPAEATRRVLSSMPENERGPRWIRKGRMPRSGRGDEDKADIAANLVAALARYGERVLLVGAGLHDDMQHEHWQLGSASCSIPGKLRTWGSDLPREKHVTMSEQLAMQHVDDEAHGRVLATLSEVRWRCFLRYPEGFP